MPPPHVQERIAKTIEQANIEKQNKLTSAKGIIEQLDRLVLSQLGVDLTEQYKQNRVIKPVQKLRGGRFDFAAVVTAQDISFQNISPVLLKEVVTHIDERITPAIDCPNEDINFVGLGNIASNMGELVDFIPMKGSSVLSSSPRFKRNDILFGRMRPYLNKVVMASFDGVCSGEIAVLRPNAEKVRLTFLHTLLLSRITLQQLTPLQSGTSLPRIYPSDILNIKLPIPSDLVLQDAISDEITDGRMKAKTLRREAEEIVSRAKGRVESMILGDE